MRLFIIILLMMPAMILASEDKAKEIILSEKGMIESIDLESGKLVLSTGEFTLSDRLKVKNHEEQLIGNHILNKGLFVEFWLMPQDEIPAYYSSNNKVITVIKILSDIEEKDQRH